MKVVLFGDSLLALVYKPLIQELESKVPGSDVYNCAVGGWDTDDGVIKAPYIASLNPDAVVISLGTNDSAPWKQVPIERFRSNLVSILKSFTDSRIVFFLPPPVNEAKQREGRQRTNILTRQYADAAKEVCVATGSVALIESWEMFSPLLENGPDYHTEDGVHLNDYGNSLLITHLAHVLNSHV